MAYATSGACSSHNGVDCVRGWQSDGTVYCNDKNWTGSMVEYDYMVMCKKQSQSSCSLSSDCKYFNLDLFVNDRKIALSNINDHISRVKSGEIKTFNEKTKKRILDELYIRKGTINVNYRGYICDCESIDANLLMYQEKYTPAISQDVMDRALSMLGGTKNQTTKEYNKLICPSNSYKQEGKCVCLSSYFLQDDKCVLRSYTSALNSILEYWTNKKVSTKKYPDGTLIKTTDHAGVYLIENGKKRAIRSSKTFESRGYKWGNIIVVSQTEMDSYSIGSDVKMKEMGEWITINTLILNVRNLPGLNGKVIARAPKGYKTTIWDKQNGWYKIKFTIGSSNVIKTGWVKAEYTI